MNIPSFDVFLDTLTPEQFQEWTEEINQNEYTFSFGKINPEQFNKNMNNLASMNLSLFVNLLSAYHEWLSEQIGNQD